MELINGTRVETSDRSETHSQIIYQNIIFISIHCKYIECA